MYAYYTCTYIHYIFGSLATVFLVKRGYSGRGFCDFPTKNLQTKIWNEHFYHEKWIPLPPPKKKRRSYKKVCCCEKMQVSGISYEGLWHQDGSSHWDGCVEIDLGNGNFTTKVGRIWVDASTTSFDNSSHFFWGCGGTLFFWKNISTHSTHT